MWHNHVENIKKAKEYIAAVDSWELIGFNKLKELLESMIADAEAGHKKIENFQEQIRRIQEGFVTISHFPEK